MNLGEGSSINWIGLKAVIRRQGDNCKPILHPLKSITTAKIIEWGLSEGHTLELCELILGHRIVESLHLDVFEMCLKNHIDIFGLIKSGQAIEK